MMHLITRAVMAVALSLMLNASAWAALSDQVALSADTNFQSRVRQAIIAAAIAISNEAVSTGFHDLRAKLARAVMNQPDTYAPLFAKAVVTDATVQSDYTGGGNLQTAVTDAHINNAVSSMWNSFFSIFD